MDVTRIIIILLPLLADLVLLRWCFLLADLMLLRWCLSLADLVLLLWCLCRFVLRSDVFTVQASSRCTSGFITLARGLCSRIIASAFSACSRVLTVFSLHILSTRPMYSL